MYLTGTPMGSGIDRVLLKIENTVMILSYVALILLVGGETVRRAIFQEQAPWGPEIAMYAFIWLSWFAMARHCRYGTNLGFTKIRNGLPRSVRKLLEVIDAILWLIIGTLVLWSTGKIISTNLIVGQVIFGTSLPIWVMNIAVPLGWAFSMVRIIQRLWLVLFRWQQIEDERTAGVISS